MASKKSVAFACMALGLLVAVVFADVLFVPGDKVASFSRHGDIRQYYCASRTFAFGELREGRLPVWNPHIFSGTPCLANFQTAIFYPPNVIYLVLPLAKAMNFDLALHVLLFGLFTFMWARSRGQNAVASFTAGAVAMFSGAFLLHVHGGHMTMVAAFAWMPLIILVVDKLMARPTVGWAMIGIGAVSLQILAGSPPVVFMTFVSVVLYAVLNARKCTRPLRTLTAWGAMGSLPLLVTAVQLWPALHFLRLCAPHGDGSFRYGSTFSFPPENLLMLVMPGFWGGIHGTPYTGRWEIWEVGFFLGMGGVFLVFVSLFRAPLRKNLSLYIIATVLIVLALGKYAPFYEPVFNYVPGFSLFRAPARLLVPASLVMAMLAGEGMQALYARPLRSKVPAMFFVVMAVVLLGCALYVHAQASVPPRQTAVVRLMEHLRTAPLKKSAISSIVPAVRAEFIQAACIALVFGALLAAVRRFTRATWLIAMAVAAEMALFAFPAKSSFHLSDIPTPGLVEAKESLGSNRLHDRPGAVNRIWNSGALDIWGSEPLVQSRYAEFIASVTGTGRPISDSGEPSFLSGAYVTPASGLTRLAGLVDASGAASKVPAICQPLPEFSLITGFTVKPAKQVLATINARNFRPATQVVLESQPDPAPSENPANATASGALLDKGPGYYVLQFDLPAPAILLNTDAYAPGWTVTPLEPSPQKSYKVMPANYALRAIPLAAGKHKIRLEYVPPLFVAGKYVSLATCLLLLGTSLLRLLHQRRPSPKLAQ